MGIHDQHLHSKFSYDSRQPMEEYVKEAVRQGDKYFTTTEHMDLHSTITDCDMVPDFANLYEERDRLRKAYPIEILNGIEVGYKKCIHSQLEKVISHHSLEWDVVIMSIHENDEAEAETSAVNNHTAAIKAYTDYLSLI